MLASLSDGLAIAGIALAELGVTAIGCRSNSRGHKS